MVGHNDIADKAEVRFVSDFLQFFYEEIARRCGVQERQALETTEGDEMEIAFAVDTF